MEKKTILVFFLMWSALLASAKQYTVVIDAGHGGKDAGAIGCNGLLEKDLNLDISQRLATKIQTAFPDVQVLLTRSSDIFLPLQSRADFVNKNKADLFICVHTNAAESRSAHGTEVFILGTDKLDDNLDVAMRENAVIKLESDYQTAYQGFNPNSVESYIMFELMQNNHMGRSLQFASLVQNEFTHTLHRTDRGVRQAAFWVLLKSACPSVLVEMGFISNADEEMYLKSDHGKQEITQALFDAFANYYKPENKSEQKAQTVEQPAVTERDSVEQTVAENEQTAEQFVWRVQIFVSRTVLPASDHNFKGMKDCTYVKGNGIYKYMYGECSTAEEAEVIRKQLVGKFPDCFVVKVKK